MLKDPSKEIVEARREFHYPDDMEKLECPVEKATSLIGSKWSILIIKSLFENDGPAGFNELLRFLNPISSRTLSAKLKELCEYEIITREVLSTTPVRVQYSLKEKGRGLAAVIRSFARWSQKWHPD